MRNIFQWKTTSIGQAQVEPALAIPQLQHRPSGRRRRTYYIEEHGAMDGEEGYWVTDETSGDQGFMAL